MLASRVVILLILLIIPCTLSQSCKNANKDNCGVAGTTCQYYTWFNNTNCIFDSLPELRQALEYWYKKTKSKVTYEYVVWKGINDDKKSIDALVKFCKYVPCKVNLIEYNPIDDGVFQQASTDVIDSYVKALESSGIVAKVRRSRGKDIDAACGQLANKS